MKVTWFGHSAFRVETGNSIIMIDPFLSDNPTWNGSVEDAANGATHVVLTHGHSDHIGDTVDICKSTGALLIANFEICMYLSAKGVENFSPGNHGGMQYHDDFDVAYVQAWHSSSDIVDGEPVYLGNPAGVVIVSKAEKGKVLYHMGDTDIFSDMGLINEIYRPTVGIVPIGDRFTMGARLAAMACKKYFAFKMVIPCHYATFPIIDQTADKFVAEMAGQNVVVPERGAAFEV
jgi:L-ascorbate metabolism protein UlaG (beta-lactamase superfamily)